MDLQSLCASPEVSLESLNAYLQRDPGAALQRSGADLQTVPLHGLCRNDKVSAELLVQLVETYLKHSPDAGIVQTSFKHIDLNRKLPDYPDQWVPLNYLCRNRNVSAELVETYLKHSPEAAVKQEWRGGIPLHHLCSNSNVSAKLVKTYLKHSPEAAVKQDHDGDVPLHFLCSNPNVSTELVEAYLRHSARAPQEGEARARWSPCCPSRSQYNRTIAYTGPIKAAFMENNRGFTPFTELWASGLPTERKLACVKAVVNVAKEDASKAFAGVRVRGGRTLALLPMRRLGEDAMLTMAAKISGDMDEYIDENWNFIFWIYLFFCAAIGKIVIYTMYGWDAVSTAEAASTSWCIPLGFVMFYGMARETAEIVAAARSHMLRNYFIDKWNVLSVVSIAISALLAACAAMQIPIRGPLRIILSIGAFIQWMELMEIATNLNAKLAAYIYAVFTVFRDVAAFLIVMISFLLAFGQLFFLLAWDLEMELGGGDRHPFDSFGSSLMSTFTMLLGDFEIDWFTTQSMMILAFVAFMTIAYLILLNMLIAIVGDSYDFARSESGRLFCKQRFACIASIETSYPNIEKHGDRVLYITYGILLLTTFPLVMTYVMFFLYKAMTSPDHTRFFPWELLRTDFNDADDDYDDVAWDGRVNNLKDYIRSTNSSIIKRLEENRDKRDQALYRTIKGLEKMMRAGAGPERPRIGADGREAAPAAASSAPRTGRRA